MNLFLARVMAIFTILILLHNHLKVILNLQNYHGACASGCLMYQALREKCRNTEFFMVRIFLYSDQEKLRIWILFTQ